MLFGLLIANRETPDGRQTAAALPVAGGTLAEAAARRLRAAGVEQLLLLTERPDLPLIDTAARLSRDGIPTRLVSDAGEVAAEMTPGDRLLLLADGALVDEDSLALLIATDGPAALTIADTPANAAWERIDADRRWGGAAIADVTMMRRVADLPPDWDPGSSILRTLLQGGGALCAGAPGGLAALVEDEDDADTLTTALGERAADLPRGPADRWLLLPLSRLIAPVAMDSRLTPDTVGWAAAAAALIAVPVAGGGLIAAALALALGSGALAAVARRMALVSWRPDALARVEPQRIAALIMTLAVAGATLSISGGDTGPAAMTGGTLAFLGFTARHRRLFGHHGDRPAPAADADSLAWLMLPFALGGWWSAGLLVLAGAAAANLFLAQRTTAAGLTGFSRDAA
ncbi:hypothetical protein GGR88_000674 [Sphingomonas jejuensis]|uniref:Uncharacterized protein n=1 Tax=Sphingomonas jejuensis TaxID=904715 RepID=A0ABX0XKD6_9SPHN|nr:hypothetical protein [Sphingomonas jejuensis]NJC33200.1 hypothetical protein [Sphingomonas jejuensis]